MPSLADLSPADRTLLKELPFKAIFAAVVSDVRGPVGAAQLESVEAAHALVTEAVTTYAGNPVVQDVLALVATDPASEGEIALKDEAARRAAMADALRMASDGARLLEQMGEPETALDYKQWVYGAAKAATEATRSGSVLNLSHVSNDEEDFLKQLQVALALIAEDEP